MSIFRKKALEKARLLQVVDMSYSQKFLHYYSFTTRTKSSAGTSRQDDVVSTSV